MVAAAHTFQKGTDADVIATLEQFRLGGLERQTPMRPLWMRCIRTLAGLRNQWVRDEGTDRLRLREPTGDRRFSANMTLPMVLDNIARMLARDPKYITMPGPDPEDLMGDSAAGFLLEWAWQEAGMRRKNVRLLTWVLTCGLGILKPEWDWNKGALVSTDLTEILRTPAGLQVAKDLSPEDLALLTEHSMLREGAPGIRVVSPYHMIFDPAASDMLMAEDRPHMELNVMTLGEIRANREWSEQRFAVEADSRGEHEDSIQALAGGAATTRERSDPARGSTEQYATVRAYWAPPAFENNYRGRHIVYAGDKLLYRGGIPWAEGANEPPLLPYKGFYWLLHPVRFYPMSLVEQLEPLQDEYDNTRSHQRLHRQKLAKGKWLLPKKSGVQRGMLTDETAAAIEYTPVGPFKPEMMNPAPMPPVEPYLDRTVGEAQLLANSVNITRGFQPPGVTAASALAIVQEEQQRSAQPVQSGIDEGWAYVGKVQLQQMLAYMPFERQVGVVGRSGIYEVRALNGQAIRSTDVRVESGSSWPQSPYVLQQLVLQLWGQGLIRDAMGNPDYRRAIRLMRLDTALQLYEADELDRRNARAENQVLAQGDLIPIGPGDNDAIHIYEHTLDLKSPEWLTLPPEIKTAKMVHLQWHRDRYKATLQEQQLLLAADPMFGTMRPGQGTLGPDGGDEPGPETGSRPSEAGAGARRQRTESTDVNKHNGGLGGDYPRG